MEAGAVPRVAPPMVPTLTPRLLRLASDARLVGLVRDGRPGAFEAVYDRHHRGILAFCRHMLGDADEAEDAVQHTFMAAYSDLIRSDKPIHLRAWLFTIARNRCYTILRARREQPSAELEEPVGEGVASQVQRRQELRELVHDLRQLPEDQRAALVLAELDALSHAEIAEVLGVPREKVKALVFQARESLLASRTARDTACSEIREQLSRGRGASLRRANLRRHLRECDGCREYRAQVERQRKHFALFLPVVPGLALRHVLKGGAAKLFVAAAVAGTAGTVVVTESLHLQLRSILAVVTSTLSRAGGLLDASQARGAHHGTPTALHLRATALTVGHGAAVVGSAAARSGDRSFLASGSSAGAGVGRRAHVRLSPLGGRGFLRPVHPLRPSAAGTRLLASRGAVAAPPSPVAPAPGAGHGGSRALGVSLMPRPLLATPGVARHGHHGAGHGNARRGHRGSEDRAAGASGDTVPGPVAVAVGVGHGHGHGNGNGRHGSGGGSGDAGGARGHGRDHGHGPGGGGDVGGLRGEGVPGAFGGGGASGGGGALGGDGSSTTGSSQDGSTSGSASGSTSGSASGSASGSTATGPGSGTGGGAGSASSTSDTTAATNSTPSTTGSVASPGG